MEKISELKIENGKIILGEKLAAEVSHWGEKLDAYVDGQHLMITPAGETPDPKHPFITRYKDVVGGEPVIVGTRVTVRAIVEYDRLYHSLERTLRALPQLARAQVEDALGYYAEHKDEIEAFIKENEQAYEQGAGDAKK